MVKLLVHGCGKSIAVGLKGEHQEIEYQFYSFFNHGAVGTCKKRQGELRWVQDDFAYFWTTKQKLLKAMTSAALFAMLGPDETDDKCYLGENLEKAKKIAQKKFDEMERADFVIVKDSRYDEFSLGTFDGIANRSTARELHEA